MKVFSMENVLFSLNMSFVPCHVEDIEAVADPTFITMLTRMSRVYEECESTGVYEECESTRVYEECESTRVYEECEFMFVKNCDFLIPLNNVAEEDASYYPFKKIDFSPKYPNLTEVDCNQIINVDSWFERCDMLFVADLAFPSPEFNVTIIVDGEKEPACVMYLRKSNADRPPPSVINVFVDSNILDFFMGNLLDKLDKTKLYNLFITPCSDSTSIFYCTTKYSKMFDVGTRDVIKHVYATNLVSSDDPRVTLLPLGTSLKAQDIFSHIVKDMSYMKPKTRNLAVDVSKDDPSREHLHENLFAYCPSLDTFDTCLFWECLYFDVVPVLVSNEISEGFLRTLKTTGLPFIIVESKDFNIDEFDRTRYDSIVRDGICTNKGLRIDSYMTPNNPKVNVSNR